MIQDRGFAYRVAAADGATQAGLLIIVYDAIAGDLVKAGNAAGHGDVPARCRHSDHALLLVGHLEGWVDDLDDPKLAHSLQQFYAMLRARILQLQQSRESSGFHALADLVCETRAAWQRKAQAAAPIPQNIHLAGTAPLQESGTAAGTRSRWSA